MCVKKKKSGTRDIPKSKRLDSLAKLYHHLAINDNTITDKQVDGKSLIVTTTKKVKNEIFSGNFYLSEIDSNRYKVKLRSSTNNPTIIFSVEYSNIPERDGIIHFKSFIVQLFVNFHHYMLNNINYHRITELFITLIFIFV